jgi:hypothetical protein
MKRKVKNSSFVNFNDNELEILRSFKSPIDIQNFLNNIEYNPEYITRSPKEILKHKKANCFEGALFAAATLRFLGYKPLIVDLMAKNDDDHVIAIFKQDKFYGAVAKSNTTLLRFREPIYKTLRELVLSYFEFYFNTLGEKSLRSYSNPIDLTIFDKYNWMTTDQDLEFIGDYLFKVYHHPIIPKKFEKKLNLADKEVIDLCFSGSIPEGLFIPKKK